jgi:hypothetical protein
LRANLHSLASKIQTAIQRQGIIVAGDLTANIFLFLSHEMSIEDFEEWIYSDHERIASAFGEEV